jgi:hypothetical protein
MKLYLKNRLKTLKLKQNKIQQNQRKIVNNVKNYNLLSKIWVAQALKTQRIL